MAAGVYDFTLEQGTTFRRTIKVGMDLTGYTARMSIAPKAGQPAAITLTTGSGITITASATPETTPSEILLTITDAQSSGLTLKRGVYDLELESTDGDVIRLLEGKVTISPEVTTVDTG